MIIFNAIEYSEINCIYIYISPGRKESFFGKKKKITEIEKLWITSFIDFQSSLRKGALLVVEKRNYNLILLEKKKKGKKIGRLFEGRKFLLSNESFSFVSVTKERKKKRLGERLVNDGHNCGLLSQ